MRLIVINKKNLVDNGFNNTYIYKFPSSINFNDSYISVLGVFLYYSWFNITSDFNNNKLSYTWTSGTTTTTYDIVIPDGLYQISEINTYLQYEMINNGTYWIDDTTGDYVYPFNIELNPTRYAVQLNTYLIPDTQPTDTTLPSNFAGFPTTPQNSIITFPQYFNDIVGFDVDFASDKNLNNAYTPPSGSKTISKTLSGTLSYLSSKAPQLQPNPTINFQISGVQNNLSFNSSVVYTMAAKGAFGSLIEDRPNNWIWNKLNSGTYDNFTLTISGTDLRPLKLQDPNITLTLVVADKEEI